MNQQRNRRGQFAPGKLKSIAKKYGKKKEILTSALSTDGRYCRIGYSYGNPSDSSYIRFATDLVGELRDQLQDGNTVVVSPDSVYGQLVLSFNQQKIKHKK